LRTLLTYVLAALAATIVSTVLRVVVGGFDVSGFMNGDPSMAAGALSALIVETGLALIFFTVVGTVVWICGSWLFRAIGWRNGLINILSQSVLTWVVVVIALLAINSWPLFVEAQFNGHAPDDYNWTVWLRPLPYSLGISVVIGLAWGSVFWLRQSKNNQTMEVAA